MSILNYSETATSPTSVLWFYDRIGDPNIIEHNIIEYTIDGAANHHFTEEINSHEYIDQTYIDNLTRRFQTQSIVNVVVPVEVDENMVVAEEQRDCCICMETKEKPEICRINCAHTFCIDCFSGTMLSKFRRQEMLTCPLCREIVTSVCVKNNENKNKFLVNQ
jgi:hypothetical protein